MSQSVDSIGPCLVAAVCELDSLRPQLLLVVADHDLGARVVPNDRATEGFSGLAAPGDGGLTLVGDPCKPTRAIIDAVGRMR